MEVDMEAVKRHFSAGRFEQAIKCLADIPSFQGMPLEQVRQNVEARSIDYLVEWCGRRGVEKRAFPPSERPTTTPYHIFEAAKDIVTSRPFAINDEESAVFAIPSATVAAGPGMISTEDGKVIQIAPDWGEERKVGKLGPRTYGNLCVRDGTDEFLSRRLPPSTTLPEAIYVWVGCKHFGINLVNVINVALLRDALGETDLPLVIQKKGMPPRRFELDAIRRLGFEKNQIITTVNKPTTFVEKLWVPHCPITFHPHHILSSSAAMSVFRRRLGIVPRDASKPGDRLYVTRRDATWRLVENEQELIAMLQRDFGFQVVEFTGLELHERLEKLANAEIILGSTGQNLFNMMFAPPGCWIGEILPVTHRGNAVRDAIAHLALSMGHRILRIPCDTRQTDEPWIRWNLSIRNHELQSALRFLEKQTSTPTPIGSA